jgi:NAD(P)-dependent dehydrogenase (short-subunit alcohol dehydrogenase family)
MAPRWTADDVPELAGRTFIVTGGNSGLGYETARSLARKRARVVLACRDPAKAKTAVDAIALESPAARVEAMELDLASLASVRSFAEAFAARGEALHGLINNAGVMALPRRRTADGFEMQLGTNHLGHFALTGLLLERLLATQGARVVAVSSSAHRPGRIAFDDLHGERRYGKWRAYAQSKLANLLFAYELQRRLAHAGSAVISVACHPGYAATNLQAAGPRMEGARWMERIMRLGNALLSQDAAMGALPTLYAATAADVRGGEFFGPDGFGEMTGYPRRVASSARSHDPAAAAKLWEVSEALTGVRYEALA